MEEGEEVGILVVDRMPVGDIGDEIVLEQRQNIMDLRAWQVAGHQQRLIVGMD